mmetsp:Transcript_150/g.299  ORF Transcript_150/g.299 Transcript_150/m.299 type:complete len:219 (-) Transcript_150:265-921(-)
MIQWDQLGRNVHAKSTVMLPKFRLPHCRPHQFDRTPHRLGIGKVNHGNLRNTYAWNGINWYSNSKGQFSQYSNLGTNIMPGYVGGRICFGKSQILCFFQYIIVVSTIFHFSEHKIGRTIADARNFIDNIPLVSRLQCMNNRNPSTNTCLISKFNCFFALIGIHFIHQLNNLIQVFRNQSLIRSNHTLPPLQCSKHRILRKSCTTCNFHYQINRVIVEN